MLDFGVAGDLAFQNITAGNGAHAGNLEHLAHLCSAQFDLAGFWSQHTLHSRRDFLDGVIDDAVHSHVDPFGLRHIPCNRVWTNVEANDDSAARLCQHNVRLADSADCSVDYLDADLRVAQFFQRLFDRLYRALYVCFDNQRQLFGLSDLDLLEQVIQRYLLVGAELLLLGLLSALFNQLTSQSFVLNGIELVACCRYLCQTGDFDRSGRTCGFDALAAGSWSSL